MARNRLTTLLTVLLLSSIAFAGNVVRDAHTDAELIAKQAGIQPGEAFTVGLRLKMDEHWHTYWRNPGDSGLATTIEWTLPEGFKASDIHWPAPKNFEMLGLINYGYENEIVLPVTITPPNSIKPGAMVKLQAYATWLACEEECIPGSAELSLELPVIDTQPQVNSKWTALFEWADSRQPTDGPSVTLKPGADNTLLLSVEGVPQNAAAYFFSAQASKLAHTKTQKAAQQGDTLTLTLPVSEYADGEVTELAGVLLLGDQYYNISTSLDDAAVASNTETEEAGEPKAASAGKPVPFLKGALFALLGGALLNLMPCVFPVLSIKILGFVNQAGEDRGKILKHGLVYAFGVVVSFWVLVAILLSLRSIGFLAAWGFQMQAPWFVAVMAVLLFVVALNLIGVFEFGIGLMNLAGKAQGQVSQSGLSGSFFSGVLAVVIATPCTAPLMGPAVGTALALPAIGAFAIFTALGLGMALPYVILSAFPKWLNYLPKPGPWMETFKQLMGFIMFGAAIWLVWLFGNLVDGTLAMMFIMGSLLVVAIGAWVWGRWNTGTSRGIAVAFMLVGLAAPIWYSGRMPDTEEVKQANGMWQEFSDEKVNELRSNGRIVFVDFTADWCLTCKWNEFNVLADQKVLTAVEDNDVAMLKADWTRKDDRITRALERFGRAGVPLYVIYPADPNAEPIVLPTVITTNIVVDAIKSSSGALASVR